MNPYTFVDMFSTKGAEYLLVILFLFSLVPFWRFLHASATPTPRLPAAEVVLTPRNEWFHLPTETFYHQGHSWVRPEGDGVVKVGMDDFSRKLIGKCREIKLPAAGSHVRQGGRAWHLAVDSKSVAMLSPVNGEVIALNDEVLADPGVANSDPYGKGWLVRIKTDDMKADLRNLLSGRLAELWMDETVNALRQRMAGNLNIGTVLQDGGLPVQGFLLSIYPENWEKVAMEFLSTGDMSD